MVEAEFQPLQSYIVDVRESQHMARDLAGRVIAAKFPLAPDARQAQAQYLSGSGGRHVAPQVDELPFHVARDAPRENVGIEIERTRQLAEPVERRPELARIRPDAVDRCADCQGLAVAIHDRTPVSGHLYRAQIPVVTLLARNSRLNNT